MGTKDLTYSAISQALSEGAQLTHDQRAALLTLVADDELWQRKHDELAEQLSCVRQALPAPMRDGVPSVAVATLTARLAGMVTLLELLRTSGKSRYCYAQGRDGQMVHVADAIDEARALLGSSAERAFGA